MNTTTRLTLFTTIVLGAGLSACDNQNEHQARCTAFAAHQPVVTSTGTLTNAPDAADGNLFSYTSFQLGTTSPMASIRASAGDGTQFKAGSEAGAFIRFRNQGSSNITQLTTTLAGRTQETATTQLHIKATEGGTGADAYLSFTTTLPFDGVSLSETDSGGANGQPVYDIYELCADGDVQ